MPITAIRSGNIFHTEDLNPGEDIGWPQIVFGINTAGTNLDWASVAFQVGQKFCTEFQRIISEGGLRIGDVHSAQGSLSHTLPTRFHGIVCNEKKSSEKHDWTFADLWVTQGLEQLNNWRIIMPWQVTTRKNSVRDEVRQITEASWNFDFKKLAELMKRAELEMNPPLRTAFIGTGPSWTNNHADWRGILQAMNDSQLNLILYLWDKEIHEQVANVVRLFPALKASAPLRRIEEIHLLAA